MSKRDKKSKSKTKHEFADISIKDVAEARGFLRGLACTPPSPISHGSNVLLEVSGLVAVAASASAYTFSIRLDATPDEGGYPVAIAQNAIIIQPDKYAQFKLTTVHFQPPQGRYHLRASLQAQSGSGPTISIDLKESDYDVL